MSGPVLESDLAWCRHHFAMMRDGGVWAVPRSGLVFTRRGDGLVLTDRMPWQDGMPMTAEAFGAFQRADAELIRDRFAAAGITVDVAL